jgi:hypothetical protein
VNIDYHVDFDSHYYSVPYQLRGQTFDLRVTESVVEILHAGQRIASRLRSHVKHKHTTDPGHKPAVHFGHRAGPSPVGAVSDNRALCEIAA